jgi:hypothetical protein
VSVNGHFHKSTLPSGSFRPVGCSPSSHEKVIEQDQGRNE